MALGTWLAVALLSLLIAIVPGPCVARIVGFATTAGQSTTLAAVIGMATGYMMAITLSLADAGALLHTSAIAFSVLKWSGAVYLVVIGTFTLVAATTDTLYALIASHCSASLKGLATVIARRRPGPHAATLRSVRCSAICPPAQAPSGAG